MVSFGFMFYLAIGANLISFAFRESYFLGLEEKAFGSMCIITSIVFFSDMIISIISLFKSINCEVDRSEGIIIKTIFIFWGLRVAILLCFSVRKNGGSDFNLRMWRISHG